MEINNTVICLIFAHVSALTKGWNTKPQEDIVIYRLARDCTRHVSVVKSFLARCYMVSEVSCENGSAFATRGIELRRNYC